MITVLAGVNGAGKSSILGSSLDESNNAYFNPDEYTRKLMLEDINLTLDEANSNAWKTGKKLLESSIAINANFTFESTLGGQTITQMLIDAVTYHKIDLSIYYCGLNSPELHIQRVKERVARGGHDIPSEKIRQRWTGSAINMLKLIPLSNTISLFDNSEPWTNLSPSPRRLFSFTNDKWKLKPIVPMPQWAKPMAAEAIKKINFHS